MGRVKSEGRAKSETRQLTEGAFVRFQPSDMDVLKAAADVLGISVAHLLRDAGLDRARAAVLRSAS